MAKSSKRGKYAYIVFRLSVICLLLAGFIYQILQFLFLYWTYPTMVDIQQSSPTYLEMPAFTFCNRIGYNFDKFCKYEGRPCAKEKFNKFLSPLICKSFPPVCIETEEGPTLPPGFKGIMYQRFMENNVITKKDIDALAVPLEDYLNCTIEFAGKVESCNMENVLGSFYATEDLPQFCYTIYSKWGNPDKVYPSIPKGSIMKWKLNLNVSRQPLPPEEETKDPHFTNYTPPLYNPPCDMAVQIAVHSPYFLPSPYFAGTSYMSARAYEIRIQLSESHLLPAPYQTNCTDYMTSWKQRGGKAPIDQLSTIQECRVNISYARLGCVPVTIDYPHSYNICKSCPEDEKKCKYAEPTNNCTLLADDYNQPCDSLEYLVEKENKVITFFERANSKWAQGSDGIRTSLPEHKCDGRLLFSPQCSSIDIEIPFDRFFISNITYNAKYESLELFSVFGGYMGIWLGISFLTVFDVAVDGVKFLKVYLEERKAKRQVAKRLAAKKRFQRNFIKDRDRLLAAEYNTQW